MQLNAASEARLRKVHPDLVRVVRRAAQMLSYPANAKTPNMGFIVTCGPRTRDQQAHMMKIGASQTMKSRHLVGADGYAKAVDIAVTDNGKVKWDWPLYARMAEIFKAAARAEKVPLEWGGDWRKQRDGPHYQLPWKTHP